MKPILPIIASVSSFKLTDEEKRLLEKYNPIGIALFSRNLKTKVQAKKLIKDIKETIGREDVLVALDQEGGRVNRLESAGFKKYASQNLLGLLNKKEIIEDHAFLMAQDMKSIGANFNFAPVLDLDYKNTTTALKSRTFSSDPKKVARFGKILWQAYQRQGICPCIKHLPGHGRAENDPHLGLPVINVDLKEMERDFYPFVKNKDCPAAMTAHILLPSIDAQNPVTCSKKAIDYIIRGLIDYQGFLISDAIDMKALKGTPLQKALRSLKAGCDAICYCFGNTCDLEVLFQNLKPMSDVSLDRFKKVCSVFKKHNKKRDVDFIQNEYYSAINLLQEEKINYDATEVLFQLQKGDK